MLGQFKGLCWVYVTYTMCVKTFLIKAQPSQSFLDLIESENSHDSGFSLHPSWSIFGGPVWFEAIWIDFESIDLDTNHSRFSFQCISYKLFNLYTVVTRLYALYSIWQLFDKYRYTGIRVIRTRTVRRSLDGKVRWSYRQIRPVLYECFTDQFGLIIWVLRVYQMFDMLKCVPLSQSYSIHMKALFQIISFLTATPPDDFQTYQTHKFSVKRKKVKIIPY